MSTDKPPQYNDIKLSNPYGYGELQNQASAPPNQLQNPYMAMGMPPQNCFQPMSPTNVYVAAPPTPIIAPATTTDTRTTTTVNINTPGEPTKRCSCCCVIISIIVTMIIISLISSFA